MTRVHVASYGCSANIGEGEAMKGLLKERCTLANQEDADIIVLNICTVKGDQTALKEIRKTKEQFPNKKIVIGGCVTKKLTQLAKEIDPAISVTSTHAVPEILQTVKQATLIPISNLKRSTQPKINLPKVRQNPIVGIVSICSGCLDACSFCSTRLIKGRLKSHPIKDIVQEVQTAVKEGCKEIWLTGQDAGCYGFDINTTIVELLKEVINVQGDFMIRLGMGNPRHMLQYIDELIEVMQHPKVFKFIHLPLQAGNDDVLKHMKRLHNVQDVLTLMEKVRAIIPEMTISTDIIVGFPGETEQQFQDTCTLIKKVKPVAINLARFAPREGTVAATLKGMHGREKKRRSRIMTDVYHEVAQEVNDEWLGWEGTIRINERGKDDSSVGRNYAYKPIVVNKPYALGKQLNVKVTKANPFALFAEVVD